MITENKEIVMPRLPILPVPDREAIFENGKTWEDWVANPDEARQGEKIMQLYNDIQLSSDVVARLSSLDEPVRIIAIAETWCGDVIKQVPLLIRMVEATNGKAQVRFISREDNPDYFARFLTNGGEAIPKFVFCNETFTEVGNYGPMPSTPRRYIAMGKSIGDVGAARKLVGQFYEKDGYKESITELLELFEIAALSELPEV